MLARRSNRPTETDRRHRHRPSGVAMPLFRCRSLPRRTRERTTVDTNIFAQVTTSAFPPALKVATVLGGVVALFVAMRVGQVLIKFLFGVIGLAVLGGAAWW